MILCVTDITELGRMVAAPVLQNIAINRFPESGCYFAFNPIIASQISYDGKFKNLLPLNALRE